ncbi:MAG: hypothetical protein ACREUW_15125 [Burkholderiales bacterium]
MGVLMMERRREAQQSWQDALVGAVLVFLAIGVSAALSASATAWAAGGMLAIWSVLLAWGLWTWRALLPPVALWWVVAACGVSLLAQGLLLWSGAAVFMQVNFVSLLAWALLCAGILSVYAFFAPREDRLYVILTVAGTVLLVALLPLTPRPFMADVVGGVLGVLPAVMVGAWLLRGLVAREGAREGEVAVAPAESPRRRGRWSPAVSGPRKLPAWPVAVHPAHHPAVHPAVHPYPGAAISS